MSIIGCFYRDFNSQGGIPVEMECLMKEVTQLGHKAIMYCYGDKELFEVRSDNFLVKQFKKPYFFFRVPGRMKLEIVNDRPDVMFVIQGHLKDNYGVCRLLTEENIKYIYSPSGAYIPYLMNKKKWIVREIWRRKFELKNLNNAEVIRTYSKTQEDFIRNYGCHRPTFELLEGIYEQDLPEQDKAYHFNHKKTNIVYLGRIDFFGKGLDELIKAFQLIIENRLNVKLHIFGPFATKGDENLFMNAIEGMDTDYLSYHGAIYGEEKYHMLGNADLLVYPSRFEGIPRTIRESLYFGTPVIVTPETNFSEYVEKYEAGYTCTCDSKSIYRSIYRFLEEKERKDFRTNARMLIKEHYNWKSVRNEMEKLFYRLGY